VTEDVFLGDPLPKQGTSITLSLFVGDAVVFDPTVTHSAGRTIRDRDVLFIHLGSLLTGTNYSIVTFTGQKLDESWFTFVISHHAEDLSPRTLSLFYDFR